MSGIQDTGQQKDGDRDTEESDFDPDFQLEPLPRAADILAELPDYPDSEEEEEVRNIMQMISVKGDSNDTDTVVKEKKKKRSKKGIQLDKSELEENVVAVENVAKKRALSPIQSPVKPMDPVEAFSVETDSTSPTRKSKRQRIEAPKIVEAKLEPKVYLNKAGEFVTGFDPTSKEAKYRRQMRMQRFGKHERVEKSRLDDSKVSIEDENEEENQGTMFERRPDAIHLYGTDDLSTDDILHYFADYSPHHIEWIDDTHCNVVWSDVHSVKRALMSLSKKFTTEELEETKAELRRKEKEEDEFYLIPGTLDRPPDDEYKGIWRLALKDNPKAHLLFMRFANTGDVKRKGAYKNSRYYSIYGNPNAPFITQTNKYRKSKQNQPEEPEEKKTNLEVKRKSNERKPPDLRRHLNKGKIDVDQIKEEYKLGKPLIETLTIEVDRSEKNADFEVLKDNDSSENSSESEASSSDVEEEQERTVEKRPVTMERRPVERRPVDKKSPKKAVIVHSSSSEASSDSSSGSDSDSSSSGSSSSSNSSSSGSDSSDSSSSDSSEEKTEVVKKSKKKHSKKNSISVKRPPVNVERRKPKSKSVAVVRPIRSAGPKISSQIQTVSNSLQPLSNSNGAGINRKKRRGRSSLSPNQVKRPRVLPSNDLRSKLASRNR